MKQKDEMIQNLLNEIDGYFIQLVYLQDLMSVEKDITELEDKMQNAPNFTLIVKCALIDSFMLAFMKLYDKSEKTKTIPNLIKKCKKNIHLFSNDKDVANKLNEFETKLNKDEYITHAIKILRVRRDSLYAHNDSKYFGKNMENDKTFLPMFELWALRDFTDEILKYVFKQLSDDEPRKIKYDADLKKLI